MAFSDPFHPGVMFWKNLPAHVRLLLRPWLIVSLALHGLFLLMPTPSEPPPVAEVPEEEAIALTPLPIVERSPQVPPSPAATPTPSPTPVVSVAPSPQPIIVPSVAPTVVSPSPATSPSPTAASPTPSASPTPTATPTATPPAEVPSPTPSPEVPETGWSAFPHPEGSATCEGVENCWLMPQTRPRSLAQTFAQSLYAQGYTLTDVTEQYLSDITGRQIYVVEKNNEPQYFLNVVSTLQGDTRYINSDEPLSEAELNRLANL